MSFDSDMGTTKVGAGTTEIVMPDEFKVESQEVLALATSLQEDST
jgi:hypothetical protein